MPHAFQSIVRFIIKVCCNKFARPIYWLDSRTLTLLSELSECLRLDAERSFALECHLDAERSVGADCRLAVD